jgi:hypothetical protein
MTIFYSLRFETLPTWRARSPYLLVYPPGTGWPSYTPRHWDSQGYGGGIRPRLHTGINYSRLAWDPHYIAPGRTRQKTPFSSNPSNVACVSVAAGTCWYSRCLRMGVCWFVYFIAMVVLIKIRTFPISTWLIFIIFRVLIYLYYDIFDMAIGSEVLTVVVMSFIVHQTRYERDAVCRETQNLIFWNRTSCCPVKS